MRLTKSLQPTPDGALSSAFAGHVISPAWLSSIVSLLCGSYHSSSWLFC